MVELTPERVFALHPKIRWVGLATDQGELLFTEMRPGVESLSPEDTDRSFMQVGPNLLAGVCERLAPWAGPLESVVSRYQKVLMVVKRIGNEFLALTINSDDAGDLSKIMRALNQIRG